MEKEIQRERKKAGRHRKRKKRIDSYTVRGLCFACLFDVNSQTQIRNIWLYDTHSLFIRILWYLFRCIECLLPTNQGYGNPSVQNTIGLDINDICTPRCAL